MSNKPKPKELGPLAQAAVNLENDFAEVERLSTTLEKLTRTPGFDLEPAQKLLLKFSEVGMRIGQEIQDLAGALEEGRQGAELATGGVSKAAEIIRARQVENVALAERFESLGSRVQEISNSLGKLREGTGDQMTDEAREKLHGELAKVDEQVGALAGAAEEVRSEARAAKFKELEVQAAAMAQSLNSTRNKIKKMAGP